VESLPSYCHAHHDASKALDDAFDSRRHDQLTLRKRIDGREILRSRLRYTPGPLPDILSGYIHKKKSDIVYTVKKQGARVERSSIWTGRADFSIYPERSSMCID
jgi:hypothetical protein